MAQKNLILTYFFWMFGGLFGLHHFYLGRDFHALTWLLTAGGYFGFGLIRDLWRIPEYVKDANEESTYMEKLAQQMRRQPKPNTNTVRYIGLVIVADAFGYLAFRSLPEELISPYHSIVGACIAPFAVSLGVYLVGNIGRHEGSWLGALFGAYLTLPIYYFMSQPVFISTFMSLTFFNSYSKRWRRTPRPKHHFLARILFIGLCFVLYLTLWTSWLYFNCEVKRDEETVKCRDAAKHFFKSPIWKEFLKVMETLWATRRDYGWNAMWRQIVESFDPVGEANALKVLGLNSTASQQEITNRYRKLSREWHPDKHKGNDKEEAQERFIEIQQAYEIISKMKSQRVAQNVRVTLNEENVAESEN